MEEIDIYNEECPSAGAIQFMDTIHSRLQEVERICLDEEGRVCVEGDVLAMFDTFYKQLRQDILRDVLAELRDIMAP
jgi:hypothetical protein